jgi:cytochrome oxidase Cu insertion factor (SCO1/SenC/PrrC family)
MKRRGVLLAAAVTFVAILLAGCARPPAKLVGSVSSEPQFAADFTLTDQHGIPFHLADTRGKVVLLSFIYTHCTDICPFVTLKIRETIPLLGKDAARVVFVAVTTDPARDTVAVNAAYSQASGLFDAWHFVTGSPSDVAAVWKSYGVGVTVQDDASGGSDTSKDSSPSRDVSPTQGLSGDDMAIAAKMIDRFGGGYEVSHTAPYWIIDPKGKLRVVMDPDVLPADIAANIKAVLGGG